ncbi:hypothetical protein [Pontibacter arcticus]|uniref:Uncharacterized protein n=1 Tax=Pontibacter arcticus TaxID=2080288 RepID=A0A364RDM9_9BACT|nr:hypothetical protein [Pontibacter arcticus]RAU82393.1 hypothetical protein DP923_11450 [Pontibacter arcticus]
MLYTLLLLLFPFYLMGTDTLLLQQDIEKDYAILQKNSRYIIDDNATTNPSFETVTADLQLLQLAASLDLAKANHTSKKAGNHEITSWIFPDGDIKALHQIESTINLDTVVTQRYLENRPPTQLHIKNNFTFRTYVIATKSNPIKLYYLTEAEQGLLKYKIENRQVQIGYSGKKEGLDDVLPRYEKEVEQLLQSIK